jgi:hypothetical protein
VQPTEEAATLYLVYTRMACRAKREMEAFFGTDEWQPAPEDILRHDHVTVGCKGHAEAQYAQAYTCAEIVLHSEHMDKLMRDGMD